MGRKPRPRLQTIELPLTPSYPQPRNRLRARVGAERRLRSFVVGKPEMGPEQPRYLGQQVNPQVWTKPCCQRCKVVLSRRRPGGSVPPLASRPIARDLQPGRIVQARAVMRQGEISCAR